MSWGHAHALYRHGASPVHGVAAQVKIVVSFGLVFSIALTPREAIWAFGVFAAIVASLVAIARLPLSFIARRAIVLIPFVLVAMLFPMFGSGDRVAVLGMSLSEQGLWDLWNVLVKAGLGFLVAVVLGATTEIADLLRGLDALHMPRIVTSIVGFAVRYIDIVGTDFARMRVAIASRGYRGRSVATWGIYARSIGTVFVRTYERGERVYLAMLARMYQGTMPGMGVVTVPVAQWAVAALVVGAAVSAMVASRVMA